MARWKMGGEDSCSVKVFARSIAEKADKSGATPTNHLHGKWVERVYNGISARGNGRGGSLENLSGTGEQNEDSP